MKLIFWTRAFCVLYLISLAATLLFSDRTIHWRDWMSGMVFAIAVYYLEQPVRNFFRKKISRNLK